ncbi:type I polyketide synthase [Actinokineospora globicatena]|uniref:Acyl transferase domain-containing protein n=1 Tax=Actinokineospora globicatena TaxID=103729 RepID=A0A9W6QKJ0_9PSEU|nr:type I polyketide synthase [Actinokineospora globicatena]GLW89893.1 hypothetical protein Aglo03_07090 [Actinokineospora globicatena]
MTRPGAGEPIAVVGLACRLPQAPDPVSYWRLLRTGTDAVTTVPPGRGGGGAVSRWGGFLAEVDRFDAEFFGISTREAAAIDPQQRLALELAWEALEDAGTPAEELRGTATGVFLGAIADDYGVLLRAKRPDSTAPYHYTGTHRSLIANRVSYVLGLRGPSLTVDSGQSSSLVGVQLACASLRSGESEVAIAGGVHLNLSAEGDRVLADFGALSPDGRCFTFDTRANGYVRGEGGGVVVLKRADRARADGDRVHCLILGGAVNNDGGGAGLAVPVAAAQASLLRDAYRNAGVDPAAVHYVELHGSATAVGDPVEAAALGEVLGAGRSPGDDLRVGSVKTNIGHLEGAAGIAGLLKVALAIRYREVPPSLHFTTPNPGIPLRELNLRVQQVPGPWPSSTPLAGVSAFGMGGTNCHLVLSGVPEPEPARGGSAVIAPYVVSAATPAALAAQAARLREHLSVAAHRGVDIGYSLAMTRSPLAQRAALVVHNETALLTGLEALATGTDAPGLGRGIATRDRQAVFVFPGQGTQWIGMGRDLLDASPVFAASVETCASALAPHVDWSLVDVLRGAAGAPPLDRDEVVQPTLFAVMVSLAALWSSWGVRPVAVVGHSQGEIAAACVAGALSVEDAARVVAVRGRLLASMAGTGSMATLRLPVDQVRLLLAPWRDRITVAGVNGPASTVVSGDRDALAELLADCARRGTRTRDLPVEYASHSPHLDGVRDELLARLASVTPREPSTPVYSTTTGRLLDRPLGAEYWFDNLRRPVLFESAVRTLLDHGHDTFVEISPHPVLVADVREIAAGAAREVVSFGTLRRGGGVHEAAMALSRAHVHGLRVDWRAVFAGSGARRVDLPTYAFQRERHWLDAPLPDVEPSTTPPRVPHADVLALVLASVGAVLGHRGPAASPDRTFRDLGLDSAHVVELCDRLGAATGLTLTPSAVFDCPTPQRLADRLRASVAGEPEPVATMLSESDADDPVVVVGMGCRFPGGVHSPDELWRLLAAGEDAVSGFPDDRGWDRLPAPPVRAGAFLLGASGFDADFFGISPREALAMDPQQRLLLEVAWETVESAGIDPRSLRGGRVGVVVGATALDYGPRLHEGGEREAGYVLTGSTMSLASGRIAYAFGFEGPAVTVDTACSSSLVALHQACRSLRAGECDLALAGGVAVMATPGMFVEFSHQGGLAADGRCKPFADGADGTGWGEGAGLVLVERLSAARRAGHRVLAVVRGSAVNSDGASNGLTAPNGRAQERVVRQALDGAGLEPSDVDFVEAHGTGTALGDPIEARALAAAYGRDRDRPLWLGSVKANIGHAQAAAGVAGVIKVVLALRHGELPRTPHVDSPTSAVDWSTGAVRLVTEHTPWPDTGRPRRAGVSAFGISGTNAHAVLEQAPPESEDRGSGEARVLVPWVLSGATPPALRAQAERLSAHLSGNPDLTAVDVAYSLGTTRAALTERAVVLGASRTALLAGLRALAEGRPAPGVVTGTSGSGRVGFVFSGQGGQWPGMGRGLHGVFPVFAAAFDEACAEVDKHLGRAVGVRDVVFGSDEALLDRTLWAQPGLFALQIGLVRLFESWGVRPDVVLGHSVGEVAAAHAAGVLSLPEAARLVAWRARLMDGLPSGGAMVAVTAGVDVVRPFLGDRVGIASVNGPESVVLSGDRDALTDVIARLDRPVRTTWLRVSHAFHSHRMEPVLAEFARIAESVVFGAAAVPVVSTLTGEPDTTGVMSAAGYWVRQVREPVRFAEGVDALARRGVDTVVEIGPDGALSALVEACAPALRRGRDEVRSITSAVAGVHARGGEVDWAAFHAGTGARRVDLPTYAFQRGRYWLDSCGPRSVGDDSAPAEWCYRVAWRRAVEPPGSDEFPGTWLVVGRGGQVTECVAALRGRGASVVVVDSGAGSAPLGERVRDLCAGRPDLRGVVSVLGLDDSPEPGLPSVTRGLALTLDLVRAMVSAEVRLWLVTSGGVAVGEVPVRPTQALLWGLGRVVGLEHPRAWGGLIDLPGTLDPDARERLADVLVGVGEDEIAIRADGVFARRLVRHDASVPAWEPRGTVLITGGTGALGAHVARWLAGAGVEHVVLVSRSGARAPGADGLCADLGALGARVSIAACDVADREALARVLASVPTVNAVVHAAGVRENGDTASVDLAEVDRALSAKVVGAENLDSLLVDVELDAFVVFSSVSATWGARGDGVYAAANAYLDAVAERRRARGLPATAVAWGPWAGAGMASGTVGEDLIGHGLNPMRPGYALAALRRVVGCRESTPVVADVDWARFGPRYSAARPGGLFSELIEVARQAEDDVALDWRRRLAGVPGPVGDRLLLDLVLGESAAVLGQDDPDAIAPQRAFRDCGCDSRAVVELRARLTRATGLPLPPTIVYSHPTPAALAAELRSRLLPAPSEPDTPATDAGASIDAMDIAELVEAARRERAC